MLSIAASGCPWSVLSCSSSLFRQLPRIRPAISSRLWLKAIWRSRNSSTAGQSYFQNKSDRARALYDVDPEWPTNWSMARETQDIMMRDRRNLVSALAQLKSGANPKTEAVAQVNFDCWIALSSVSSLGPESERCRNAFRAALQQIKAGQ